MRERQCRRPGRLLRKAVDPGRRGYETLDAALLRYRASRGFEPEKVWLPDRVDAVRRRLLLFWCAFHLSLGFVLAWSVVRPQSR